MSQLTKLLVTSAVVIGLLIAARFATASHGSSAGFIISLLGLGVAAIAFAPETWSSIIGPAPRRARRMTATGPRR